MAKAMEKMGEMGEMGEMGKISEADIPWQELRQVCEQSIELAQDLGHHLRRGVAGPQLQPLLEESAELVGHLRGGIRKLASRGEKVDSAEREQLLARMRVLLQLEEQNHAQLGSKGVRLNTPRSYRYNAGSRAHQNRPAPTESNRI